MLGRAGIVPTCMYACCLTFCVVATVVLNERQRVAKRKLIEDNRSRKRSEEQLQAAQTQLQIKDEQQCAHDVLTQHDHYIIDEVVSAYEQTTAKVSKPFHMVSGVNRDEWFSWEDALVM